MNFEVSADGESVTATLRNGEKIRIYVGDDGLGITGYSLRVLSQQALIIKPSAGNAVVLTTPKCIKAVDALIDAVVAQRDGKAEP